MVHDAKRSVGDRRASTAANRESISAGKPCRCSFRGHDPFVSRGGNELRSGFPNRLCGRTPRRTFEVIESDSRLALPAHAEIV